MLIAGLILLNVGQDCTVSFKSFYKVVCKLICLFKLTSLKVGSKADTLRQSNQTCKVVWYVNDRVSYCWHCQALGAGVCLVVNTLTLTVAQELLGSRALHSQPFHSPASDPPSFSPYQHFYTSNYLIILINLLSANNLAAELQRAYFHSSFVLTVVFKKYQHCLKPHFHQI